MKAILDACCGSRMFWFDKENKNVDFCDLRVLNTKLCDGRKLEIKPDIVCDFTDLPMKDNTYHLVVFDPPHLIGAGDNSWLAKKYGKLPKENWQEILRKGFSECMRVLKPNGVLIFKWNETDVTVSKIIDIVGQMPLFGHKSGKREKTHWLCFMKFENEVKSALEKQIPKKPPLLRTVWENHYSCPFCNRRIFAKENFCSYCGQALDWGE